LLFLQSLHPDVTQTASRELQLERGWFLRNGGCGYVPKPDFMVSGCFDPSKAAARDDSVDLTVSVLCGRHLVRKVKTSAAVDVFVKVEVVGCSVDCAVATTEVVQVRMQYNTSEEMVTIRRRDKMYVTGIANEAIQTGTFLCRTLSILTPP
jgi:hypothetical protein